jgi:hypothetical protein
MSVDTVLDAVEGAFDVSVVCSELATGAEESDQN